jgi:hypothetical protein
MPVDIAQLRTLFWIARLGSFRAAAARLNVSQPTISLRIKSWEQELGFPLFKRAGRSVALSDDGAAVLEYAERVIALLDNLDHRVASQGGVGGFLQLGAPDSFALLCLADLLSDLEARHPKLRVSVTVDNSAVLFRRLTTAPSTSASWRNPPIRAGSASIHSGGISSCGSPARAPCPGRTSMAGPRSRSFAFSAIPRRPTRSRC